jgi:type IV pilus assembly protein PilC
MNLSSQREKNKLALSLFPQLAAASHHGFPMHEVAHVLAQDTDLPLSLRKVLSALSAELSTGVPLWQALSKWPEVFPLETQNWLRIAQERGQLTPTLLALAHDAELQQRDPSALRLALAWPVFLGLCAILVCVIAALFVLPAFGELFSSFGQELPSTTSWALAVGKKLPELWWLWMPTSVIAVAYATRWFPEAFLAAIDSLFDHLSFVWRYRLSGFVLRLLHLSKASVEDPNTHAAALAYLAASSTSNRLNRIASRLAALRQSNQLFSLGLANETQLPQRLALFVQLGEKMNALSAASPAWQHLIESAELTHAEAAARCERRTVVLIYAALAVVIGNLVFAIYLPVFKLGQFS